MTILISHFLYFGGLKLLIGDCFVLMINKINKLVCINLKEKTKNKKSNNVFNSVFL